VRVGILGGTFDPPHHGHLIAAQDAIIDLELDKVIFIPAAVPPHKQRNNVTAPAVRLRMIEAATRDDGRFEVSDVELRRTGPSYTVDTLRELRAARPTDQLFLLLGVDQVREFESWREPKEVLKLAALVMLARAGIEDDGGRDIVEQTVRVTRIDVSSTLVRERVRTGRPIRYLVPAAVEKIIADERLYQGSLG
jgi:nicotinate-nucleotide adenylyltransferase